MNEIILINGGFPDLLIVDLILSAKTLYCSSDNNSGLCGSLTSFLNDSRCLFIMECDFLQ